MSAQPTHTPGPWEIEAPFDDSLSIVEAGKEAYEWDFLANVPLGEANGGKDAVTAEANARLIAAAPELLAASEEAAQWFTEWEEDNTDKHSGYASNPLRAAILKAKGGAL